MPLVLRETAEPLRDEDVPVERTAELPPRDTLEPEERATLVKPVEDRRVAVPVLLPAVVPPRVARVRVLPEPPRETKLRVLRLASRPPTWRARLLRWIQRSLPPPTP